MSSPSNCWLLVLAVARLSVCHSKNVFSAFPRCALDMNGVCVGLILKMMSDRSSRMPTAPYVWKVLLIALMVYSSLQQVLYRCGRIVDAAGFREPGLRL